MISRTTQSRRICFICGTDNLRSSVTYSRQDDECSTDIGVDMLISFISSVSTEIM